MLLCQFHVLYVVPLTEYPSIFEPVFDAGGVQTATHIQIEDTRNSPPSLFPSSDCTMVKEPIGKANKVVMSCNIHLIQNSQFAMCTNGHLCVGLHVHMWENEQCSSA